MKSISSSKKSSKKPLLAALLLFVIVCVAGVFFYMNSARDKSSVNLSNPTSEQINAGNEQKKKSIEGTDPSSAAKNDPDDTRPDANDQANLSVTITAANQNSGVLQIRTLINAISNDGSCTLTLTQGDKTITKQASTQAQATTSTCEGFDVPVSDLSPGSYNIKVSVVIDSLAGSATRAGVIQ